MEILKLKFFVESMSVLLKHIQHILQTKKKIYICITGVHGLVESLFDKQVCQAHKNASYIVPDGMPLVWLGKLLRFKNIERIYGPKLFLLVNDICQRRNKKIFLCGSSSHTLTMLRKELVCMFPNLVIAGSMAPPYRPMTLKEKHSSAERINASKADVVWVGIGTPKQELWMHEMRPILNAPVIIGVGAAFDFVSRQKRQAPEWMQHLSLEWLFRLVLEPRRLWFRYTQCVLLFPYIAATTILKHRRKLRAPVFKIGVCLFILLMIYGFVYRDDPKWIDFRAYGGIYGPIISYRNSLVFGTSESRVYAIDKRTGNKIWEINVNSGAVLEYIQHQDYLIVISGDSLYKINAKSGNILWKQQQEHSYDYLNLTLTPPFFLIGDKEGDLALRKLSDGSVVWRKTVQRVEKLSTVELNGSLDYFGSYLVNQNRLFFANSAGILEAMELLTGKTLWSIPLDSIASSGPDIIGKFLLISTKHGSVYAIDPYTGIVRWQLHTQSPIQCLTAKYGIMQSDNEIVRRLIRTIFTTIHIDQYAYRPAVITVQKNGTISLIDVLSGRIIWAKTINSVNLTCPSLWNSTMYLSSSDGTIYALTTDKGIQKWSTKKEHAIAKMPALIPNARWYLPGIFRSLAPPRLLVRYNSGSMYSLYGKNGGTQWKHDFDFEPNRALINSKYIYIGQSGGALSAVTVADGQTRIPKDLEIKNLITKKKHVGENEIFEITFTLKDYPYKNPWNDVRVQTNFIHKSGKVISVDGFYYDVDTWKIRFNPTDKGSWDWNLVVNLFGHKIHSKGSFYSESDTKNSFLRINSINPRVLTTDGHHILNGVGIGDVLLDGNYTGNILDDWAIGNSEPLIATNAAGKVNYFRSNNLINLDTYLNAYGSKGAGFNLFRISLTNAAISLWNTFDLYPEYSTHNGQQLDTLIESLREEKMHVWLTLFGFGIPFFDTLDTSQEKTLRSYIKYVVARYGAYVDVWELANELFVPPKMLGILTDELRIRDFEKKPISTSFEQPDSDEIQIISPHWYENENPHESDLRIVELAKKYGVYKKPIIVGEQGNILNNYDETSAERMRIRSWTAFFKHISLIFWNQSDTKIYHNKVFHNGNLFIGDEEREYVSVLQGFTKNIPLEAKESSLSVLNSSMRSYALEYNTGAIGYLINASDEYESATVLVNRAATIQWIDTRTGIITKENHCSAACAIRGPAFYRDQAIRMMYE